MDWGYKPAYLFMKDYAKTQKFAALKKNSEYGLIYRLEHLTVDIILDSCDFYDKFADINEMEIWIPQ